MNCLEQLRRIQRDMPATHGAAAHLLNRAIEALEEAQGDEHDAKRTITHAATLTRSEVLRAADSDQAPNWEE